jgi:hypothetical protein
VIEASNLGQIIGRLMYAVRGERVADAATTGGEDGARAGDWSGPTQKRCASCSPHVPAIGSGEIARLVGINGSACHGGALPDARSRLVTRTGERYAYRYSLP